MKRFLLLLALVGLVMPRLNICMAETQKQHLIVHQKSGDKVYFDLQETPVTTFKDGQLVITTSSETIYYPLADVSKYTYEGISEGIDNVLAPGMIEISHNNEVVMVKGMPADAEMAIYSIDGKLLASCRAVAGKTAMLTLTPFPAGIYIVQAGGTSYKIEKR